MDVKETESDIIGDPLVIVLVFGRIIVVALLVRLTPSSAVKAELAVTVTFFIESVSIIAPAVRVNPPCTIPLIFPEVILYVLVIGDPPLRAFSIVLPFNIFSLVIVAPVISPELIFASFKVIFVILPGMLLSIEV